MKNKSEKQKIFSSFRDPSGFLFFDKEVLLRQVNFAYKEHYDLLMASGLFGSLVKQGLLISHKEADTSRKFSEGAYKVIEPEIVPFISYPYEWCFSQLKDAALAILKIEKIALDFKMTLKDASAYNIQFLNGKPVLIDTLSFKIYKEGRPWVAYRQFCQHFLAPLALMSKNIYFSKLFLANVEGVPLPIASSLLPKITFLNPSILVHIHFHSLMQNRPPRQDSNPEKYRLSKTGLISVIESLSSAVSSLKYSPKETEWGDYYNQTNYSGESFEEKKRIISGFVDKARPKNVWDIGANSGEFSRIAGKKGIKTISFDVDFEAVEKNYLATRAEHEENILPLVFDVANPSPAIGWANKERMSLKERGPAEMVFALALVHHLAITGNIPFSKIAEFLSQTGNWLVAEFVEKEDSQIKKMLASSLKEFPEYSKEKFEEEFKKFFCIKEIRPISGSKRILYLMKKI